MQDDGDGRYHQDLALPRHGQWDVQLMAVTHDAHYAIEQRVIVP